MGATSLSNVGVSGAPGFWPFRLAEVETQTTQTAAAAVLSERTFIDSPLEWRTRGTVRSDSNLVFRQEFHRAQRVDRVYLRECESCQNSRNDRPCGRGIAPRR